VKVVEVHPWPVVGHFYAEVNPVSLIRVKTTCDPADDRGSIILERWTPFQDAEEMFYILPLPLDKMRFLGHRATFATADVSGRMTRFVIGDVILLGRDMLIFVGPGTTRDLVEVFSDEPFLFESKSGSLQEVSDIPMRLFQPGNGRRTAPGKTAFERIAGKDVV
jgi:hypothetical protein